ncbi:dicarboxylate/amino acid:cation symporter [Chiayiivirga flava]|uniref:DAACS family dicarboxylate/amino acid:cation (Na+ or H+) symporter n=1 Tax=Chiayiivirga flava TaxID=659595 RepID=A0A7W8G0L0_9GAMM|nr:dicarboxylate/amino acid:cation symporter [Chiayiivirga flava]MBB5209301.1 DAACS family dicarboxylate/amino acid:cation (Na+ or H+) symporter [Chiayiivirga flava]
MSTGTGGIPLHIKMAIGFAAGLLLGLAVHAFAGDAGWVKTFTDYVTQPIGQVFLRLLFMLVIPLLFSALVMGVAEMGDIRALGRIGWKTLAYTIVVSSIAVVIGLAMVNVFQPGGGVDPALAQRLLADGAERAQGIVDSTRTTASGMGLLIGIVPDNVIRAAANNDILAVMFFALMFGIGLVMTKTRGAERMKGVIEGLFEISMTLINLVIRFAPIAVACLVFNLAALFGWELLLRLGAFVGVVVAALAIHFFVVYSAALYFAGGMSPLFFFRNSQAAIVMAFSTASSNATLPTALKVADEKLGLPRRVARFVLTIGATANQNGTALFEGVTVLFLAQFFGVDLSLGQQVVVMLVCILGGIGTAGVPAGSLPVIALICGMVGVPPEGIGLILGVDRFLDMCRTTLNVTGDLVAAVVVSRGESDTPDASAGGDATVPDQTVGVA